MTIAVVDSDRRQITRLSLRLNKLLCGDGSVTAFASGTAFTAFLLAHNDRNDDTESAAGRIDMAFVRADAPDTDWRALCRLLQETLPRARFVLMADSDGYALEAIRLHIHDYLVLPVTDRQLLHALLDDETLAQPLDESI